MPDSKENKQADAGSCLFRRHFLCGALLCKCSSAEREGLSTYIYIYICTTGMFSRILYAQNPVTKNLHVSPWFSPTIFHREANSVLIGYMRRTLYFQLFMMRA